MKKFETPSIEVSAFAAEDVMTLSENGGYGGDETPGLPGGFGKSGGAY